MSIFATGRILRKPLVAFLLVASVCWAQQDYPEYPDYQEYADYNEQDNLYANYAAHQEMKQVGGGGIGLPKLVLSSALSWFLGAKFHSGRTAAKLKKKHQKEQKALYSQYYNDVYKLTDQNADLQLQIQKLKDSLKKTEQKHELEAIQRDYDEFKQPDIDGDDRISRAEFNMYVKNYLSNYPGLTEKDYPKFEDFDHDGDGYVSFQEYSQQMALQAQQAELDALNTSKGTSTNKKADKKAQALQDLYKASTKGSSDFKNLYA